MKVLKTGSGFYVHDILNLDLITFVSESDKTYALLCHESDVTNAATLVKNATDMDVESEDYLMRDVVYNKRVLFIDEFIANKSEIDRFLFEHRNNGCHSIQSDDESKNIAWVDNVTGEQIPIFYELNFRIETPFNPAKDYSEWK